MKESGVLRWGLLGIALLGCDGIAHAQSNQRSRAPSPAIRVGPPSAGAVPFSVDALPAGAGARHDGRGPLGAENGALGTSNTRPAPQPMNVPTGLSGTAGAGVSLLGLIATALNANPDLQSATEQLRIADATLARARAEFFPKLSLTEAYFNTNIAGLAFFLEVNQRRLSLNQNFNHPGFVNNFSTFVTLQQNIYSGGRRKAEELSAAHETAAARFALAGARNDMVYRVAEAYYRLIQARDLVESREASVRQVEKHLELVRSRYENGTAVRSDVLTVEVRQAETREGLITATNQRALAWAVLENVVGSRLPRELAAPSEPAPWSSRVDAVEAAIVEALNTRPELGQSLSQTGGAAHRVDAARAAKRLNVDFVGNFSTFDIYSNSGGNGLFIGVLASVNLFDGHRTKAEVRRASARVCELQARHRRLLMDIELEVRQAYIGLKDAEERLQVASRAIGQADESVREIENRYEDQKATITQLIDAQVAATNARVRRANAAAELEIARAGVERVVGRLSQVLGP